MIKKCACAYTEVCGEKKKEEPKNVKKDRKTFFKIFFQK